MFNWIKTLFDMDEQRVRSVLMVRDTLKMGPDNEFYFSVADMAYWTNRDEARTYAALATLKGRGLIEQSQYGYKFK